MKLTGPVLASIFLGEIKTWGDPRIAAINPGLKLPNLPITVVHRSDGSGTSAGKNDDIAVTTEDAAELGQVVTVRGPVTLDKNLGAGYNFPVLLEKARLSR